MKIGPAGIALIQGYEKCRLRAYKPTPNDVWTCGWGSTKGVTQDTVWTQEQADAAFLEDLEWVEACINRCVTVPITENETDALASLIFNIGCTAFEKSTLLRLLNASDYDGAAAQFARWDKQGGKVLTGLTARRSSEAVLFEKGTA